MSYAKDVKMLKVLDSFPLKGFHTDKDLHQTIYYKSFLITASDL